MPTGVRKGSQNKGPWGAILGCSLDLVCLLRNRGHGAHACGSAWLILEIAGSQKIFQVGVCRAFEKMI